MDASSPSPADDAAAPDPQLAAAEASLETEEGLVSALRAGRDEAYAALVRRYGGRLLAVTRRLLRSEADAEDAVQDAFLAAFRAIDGFEGHSRLSTWLHRIAVNAALMRLRTKRRHPESSIEELLPHFGEDGLHVDQPVDWRGTDARLERQETREWVRAQIDRLPETYRTALVLRDIEELDTQETADLLGITPNAVKIRLHRARLALRELLDSQMREER
jgi:RNA polymerase sigma-70 factor, ECF subfamily